MKRLMRRKAAGLTGFAGAATAYLVAQGALDPLWLSVALGLLVLAFRLPGQPFTGIGLAVAIAGGLTLAEEGHRALGAVVGATPFLQALESASRRWSGEGEAGTGEA